jgi:hypothetical protein
VRIILKSIFNRWDWEACAGLLWLRTGTFSGACEWGNDPFGFIKYGEFIDELRNC